MTSEEFGFGTERTSIGVIAKLATICIVACIVFVGAMYFLGKGNTNVLSTQQEHATTTQSQ